MSTTSDLTPAAYNPRKVTPEDLKRLRKQLQEFGDLGGITYNTRTGNLVGGHQRVTALDGSWPITKQQFSDETGTVSIGHIDTPFGRFAYREVDWDEQKEKLANLAANNNAGKFDEGKLKDVLIEIKELPVYELSGLDTSVIDKVYLDPDPPEVRSWDLSDIEEPFWIVVRGPVKSFHRVRDHLRLVETSEIVVESSL